MTPITLLYTALLTVCEPSSGQCGQVAIPNLKDYRSCLSALAIVKEAQVLPPGMMALRPECIRQNGPVMKAGAAQ